MISRLGTRHLTAFFLATAALAATPFSTSASASGQVPPPVTFRWDRFEPAGLGISLLKPKTLRLQRLKVEPRGFLVFRGKETLTGTLLTLYVTRGTRRVEDLERDLHALTGQGPKAWVAALARGPRQGFAFQRGLFRESKTRMTQSALLMAHATRPLSYILIVEVDLATATRNLPFFTKAYEGMRALP